jgi:hypothetical protein
LDVARNASLDVVWVVFAEKEISKEEDIVRLTPSSTM